jgi:hypothetical protein
VSWLLAKRSSAELTNRLARDLYPEAQIEREESTKNKNRNQNIKRTSSIAANGDLTKQVADLEKKSNTRPSHLCRHSHKLHIGKWIVPLSRACVAGEIF